MSVVFTNGCFDVLHKGHVEYLAKSKALGNKLIVGLNSDASVRALKPGRPINNQEDRMAVLMALRCIDEVIIFDEPTPLELIRRIKPDIITKGGDYKPEQVVGFTLVKQTVIVPFLDGYSSTRTIHAITRNGGEGLGFGVHLGDQRQVLREADDVQAGRKVFDALSRRERRDLADSKR
jgi:rfaE bifunctional protein nucleotidyltransferase chain/domain